MVEDIGVNENEDCVKKSDNNMSKHNKLKSYILASNSKVTVVCLAKNKKDALKLAKKKMMEYGYYFDLIWSVYTLEDYFDDEENKAILFD